MLQRTRFLLNIIFIDMVDYRLFVLQFSAAIQLKRLLHCLARFSFTFYSCFYTCV